MQPLFEDILDEVEELATRVPTATLAQLLEDRAHALEVGAPGRAAWLAHAGERWELLDDLDRARRCYEEAVADGGGAYLDPRADLANVLFDLGETARAEEVVDELWRETKAGGGDDVLHERVGEVLELHDRLEAALRWFNIALSRVDPDDPEAPDLGCLNGHWRVRRALGLPLDRFDLLSEERRRQYSEDFAAERRELEDAARMEAAPIAVVYWAEAELGLLLQRWPELADAFGADHAEHRARVEHRLRELAHTHPVLAVGNGTVEDYLGFTREHKEDPLQPAARGIYGAHLAFHGRTTPWPPGRNDRCWCGSGVKYKKCCGAPGFAARP
ncbi:SEC-C domain-containing protein [Nocardioides pakistanensis]